MCKSALIVVDLQHDFLPGGPVPTLEKGIVDVISELVTSGKFDLTVASQDWHPQVSTCQSKFCGWCLWEMFEGYA